MSLVTLSCGSQFDPATERDLYLYDEISRESIKILTEKIQAIERYDIETQKDQLEKLEEVFNTQVNVEGVISNVSPKYSPQPINLYISSYGGNAHDCLGFCGLIETCETPINTIATGIVASAGFIILCAGHYRMAYKNTTFLYHSIRCWNVGTFAEQKSGIKFLEKLQKSADEIVIRGSVLTQEDLDFWSKDKNLDWEFQGDEALKYMIVDELLDYEPDFKTECDDCNIENCEDIECDA
jgi:ATP-dependent protease ClpP protease subunit